MFKYRSPCPTELIRQAKTLDLTRTENQRDPGSGGARRGPLPQSHRTAGRTYRNHRPLAARPRTTPPDRHLVRGESSGEAGEGQAEPNTGHLDQLGKEPDSGPVASGPRNVGQPALKSMDRRPSRRRCSRKRPEDRRAPFALPHITVPRGKVRAGSRFMGRTAGRASARDSGYVPASLRDLVPASNRCASTGSLRCEPRSEPRQRPQTMHSWQSESG
ncbi:hypothetical protein ABIB14_003074 [Arthrobacter sp. UYEF3]